jgi:hypothetical protein
MLFIKPDPDSKPKGECYQLAGVYISRFTWTSYEVLTCSVGTSDRSTVPPVPTVLIVLVNIPVRYLGRTNEDIKKKVL